MGAQICFCKHPVRLLACLASEEGSTPFRSANGAVVQREDTGVASLKQGFDSPQLHENGVVV